MKKPEMSIVRFSSEDVIATSETLLPGMSASAYQAHDNGTIYVNGQPVFTNSPTFDGQPNYVDGVEMSDPYGLVLIPGNWYHYVSGDGSGFSGGWQTCNDETHRSNGN